MKLGLESEFDAAHRLPKYDGRCANLHGHTYRVEAVFEGEVDATGFVIDFYDLKKILRSALDGLDHRDLNEIMPNPTAELIAGHLWKELVERLEGRRASLVSLKLWEGKDKWVLLD